MGSTAGLVSEYEYWKSKGRSDFSGSFFGLEFGSGGFCPVLGFLGFWGFGENGGSSSMHPEQEWISVKGREFRSLTGSRVRILRFLLSFDNI